MAGFWYTLYRNVTRPGEGLGGLDTRRRSTVNGYGLSPKFSSGDVSQPVSPLVSNILAGASPELTIAGTGMEVYLPASVI